MVLGIEYGAGTIYLIWVVIYMTGGSNNSSYKSSSFAIIKMILSIPVSCQYLNEYSKPPPAVFITFLLDLFLSFWNYLELIVHTNIKNNYIC